MLFTNKYKPLKFTAVSSKIMLIGLGILTAGLITFSIKFACNDIFYNVIFGVNLLKKIIDFTSILSKILVLLGVILIILSVIIYLITPDAQRIKQIVCKNLFAFQFGNPLHLKDGEIIPTVTCIADNDNFILTIQICSVGVEEIQKLSSFISSCLNSRKYKNFAVIQTDTDISLTHVKFTISDIGIHREIIVNSLDELPTTEKTKLIIQNGTFIDLTTSGSMLVAGKTRSGKTTAIISLLLQALKFGRDNFNSEVMIIDPKQAELSRLSHTYTLDVDGEARGIIEAIKKFADSIVKRQQVLNELSEKCGNAVHWWDAGFHCSFLFIDEYVAARTIFPKRATKENGEYCLATFDGLIKRIVTMGASAGCYAIISIAEASVEEGGLPSMLKSAMSTKILFKPTLTEGRLLWDSDKLKDFPERIYNAGDAWFSSTDGLNDNVKFVHFPIMKFSVYGELGRLLEKYYS